MAFCAVLLGSLTRITGVGMSCPQWPACTLDPGTLWEWLHRAVVFAETFFVASLVLAAWPQRRRLPFVSPMLAIIGALFLVQVLLGAATVRLSNSPISVVLHWGTAMAFLAALVALAIFARTAESGPSPSHRHPSSRLLIAILGATSIVAFITMCIGAYVSSSGAGLACVTIPGCAGNVVVYGSGQYVQMLHRFLAGACLLSGAAAFAFAWRNGSPRVRLATSVGLGLLFSQVVLGLLNVALRLPLVLREGHAANAALAFLVFVMATTLAALDTIEFRKPVLAQ